MRKQLLLVLGLLLIGGVASAQRGTGLSSGTSPTVGEVKKAGPPKLGGFQFDFSLYDDTGLNRENYNNGLSMYFEPTWAMGKLFFRDTRFSRLALAARFSIGRQFAGYDPGSYSEFSDNGFAVRCSNLQVAANGTVDPTLVRRCQYDASRRWDYSDLWFTLRNPRIYTIPTILVNLNPSIRGVVPTSAQSRYETLRFALTGYLGVNRLFLNDRISLGYTFGFTKYFHEYTTPGTIKSGSRLRDDMIANGYQYADVESTNLNFLSDPSRIGTIDGLNPDFSLSHMFDASFDITSKLNLDVLYVLRNGFAYEARCGLQEYGNVITDACANANTVAKTSNGVGTAGRAHKDSQIFWLTLSYQALDWLNVSVAWVTAAPLRKADNSYRQAIISTNYDAFTTISIGTTVTIDRLIGKFL